MATVDKTRQNQSLRLWFRFKGDQVELIRQEAVKMIAPPLVGNMPVEGKHHGTWVELRDIDDQRISAHHAAGDPFSHITEQVVDGKLCAVITALDSGTFDIVVPDLPNAHSALLFASRDHAKTRSLKAAVPIGRFTLKNQQR